MNMYSMPGYFQNMPTVGKALVNPNPENEQELKAVPAFRSCLAFIENSRNQIWRTTDSVGGVSWRKKYFAWEV